MAAYLVAIAGLLALRRGRRSRVLESVELRRQLIDRGLHHLDRIDAAQGEQQLRRVVQARADTVEPLRK